MKFLRVRCRVNTTDESVIREVLERHAYQNLNVPMRVNVGDVWLDLGANIGTFTLGVVGFGGTVVAVECEESNLVLLAENVVLNGFEDSVTVVPKAVSMEEGEVELFVCTARRNTYRHSLKIVKNREPVIVQSTTLATLLTDHPSVTAIKLDIEGSEMEILESLDASVVANVQKIVFEWTFDYDPDIDRFLRTIAHLETCGFTVYYNGEQQMRGKVQKARAQGTTPEYKDEKGRLYWPAMKMVYCRRTTRPALVLEETQAQVKPKSKSRQFSEEVKQLVSCSGSVCEGVKRRRR